MTVIYLLIITVYHPSIIGTNVVYSFGALYRDRKFNMEMRVFVPTAVILLNANHLVMRKRVYYLVVPATILSLLGVFFLEKETKSETRRKYLNAQKEIQGVSPAGPDKSTFRDIMMLMNPATGKVPRMDKASLARQSAVSKGQSWEQVPTIEVAGRMRSFMVDPNNSNALWAGSVTGGLWYNSDFRNNAKWEPISDDWESLSISSIAYDPLNTQTFYVGTGESYTSVPIYRESSSNGVGIYKTTDGGASWTLLSASSGFDYVNDIIIRDEGGTSVIYVAVASGVYQGSIFDSSPTDGLYRSTDGGESWSQVLPNISGESFSYAVSDIEVTNDGQLYVGTMRNLLSKGGGMILNSTNGVNWNLDDRVSQSIEARGQELQADITLGRVVLAAGQKDIYAIGTAGVTNSFGHIRDSPNFTEIHRFQNNNWTKILDPLRLSGTGWTNIPWHALSIVVDPADDDKIIIGAFNLYATSNATKSIQSPDWRELTNWSVSTKLSDFTGPLFEDEPIDDLARKFVHADIHQLQFLSGTDEFLIATDGGIYYSANISERIVTPAENLNELTFKDINNGLSTLQSYTVALHPRSGNDEVMIGTQDNHTFTTVNGGLSLAGGIGFGDGAFCFFDRDNSNVRITSSQVNNYTVFIDKTVWFPPFMTGGSFINPGVYDDRTNLIYTNMATDGGFQQLIGQLQGRFLDSLLILNVNKILQTEDLGLDTLGFIQLGTNSQAAFSAFKISPHTTDSATMIIGNQLGDVYKVSGLPFKPNAKKIDGDKLPVGYISSVDIGATEDHVLVTLSNFDVASVWLTRDGGNSWINLERDLPDLPIRDGLFNPSDHNQIVIATERGIWGLENVSDTDEGWTSYNDGFPNVRVDMIQIRESDNRIVAATHGRGIFLGRLAGGEVVLSSDRETPEDQFQVYPNPTSGKVNVPNDEVKQALLWNIEGKFISSLDVKNNSIELSPFPKGLYLLKLSDSKGEVVATQKIYRK